MFGSDIMSACRLNVLRLMIVPAVSSFSLRIDFASDSGMIYGE